MRRPNFPRQHANHKFCRGCGGKMLYDSETTHYDRMTGDPVLTWFWRCANFDYRISGPRLTATHDNSREDGVK